MKDTEQGEVWFDGEISQRKRNTKTVTGDGFWDGRQPQGLWEGACVGMEQAGAWAVASGGIWRTTCRV